MAGLKAAINSGAYDVGLASLYGQQAVTEARARLCGLADEYTGAFGAEPSSFFSAPGRTEIGGNHTDHQCGHVLAAAVDLDIIAAVSPDKSGFARVISQGYGPISVDLSKLEPIAQEQNSSAALIRGVAAGMKALGCPMEGLGFTALVSSGVPGGSGLSSSAAFEILIGCIMNSLFWNGTASPVQLAQVGKFAENMYFGKPSGLMDQTASSVGGVVSIDFQDPSAPLVSRLELDLAAQGYALCILDSRASHADLTCEYTAITRELALVSRHFGKQVLRQVDEAEFYASLPRLRSVAGDRAVLRAMHFFEEDRRAVSEADALSRGDFPAFLELVRASGRSSALYMQNVVPTGQTANQELMLTIALAERLLAGSGAVRVHGGGFGGTAQAFVPLGMLPDFKQGIEAVLGTGTCHVLSLRSAGGTRII